MSGGQSPSVLVVGDVLADGKLVVMVMKVM
jgi:hypothetical protein